MLDKISDHTTMQLLDDTGEATLTAKHSIPTGYGIQLTARKSAKAVRRVKGRMGASKKTGGRFWPMVS